MAMKSRRDASKELGESDESKASRMDGLFHDRDAERRAARAAAAAAKKRVPHIDKATQAAVRAQHTMLKQMKERQQKHRKNVELGEAAKSFQNQKSATVRPPPGLTPIQIA